MAKAKEITGIDCVTDTRAGIRLVLEARLAEVFELRDAALDGGEPKGLHDMRVATRRMRSAVRDFMPLLRHKRRLGSWQGELKKVADALGEVRDRDVAIKALEGLAEEAPAEARAGIERFVDGHRREREAARVRLSLALTDEALAGLRTEFERALGHALGGEDGDDGDASAAGFRDSGREVVLGRWREVRKASASLYHPFRTKRLHKMRIAAKRLRYAVELFAPCWGGEPLKDFAKEVAEMQTSLGELHDCDVWTETLGARLAAEAKGGGAEKGAPGGGPEEERRAAVWLLAHFAVLRAGHFRDAFARWHEWESGDFAARLKSTLEAPPAPAETADGAASGSVDNA